MNALERFLSISSFERPNDPFFWSVDAWFDAYKRWMLEGMPVAHLENRQQINDHLLGRINQKEILAPNSCITGKGICNNPPWVPPLDPFYDLDVLQDDGVHITRVDWDGCIIRMLKEGVTMPQYLEYPVKDRATWNEYKKRLSPFSKGRFPSGWEYMDARLTDFVLDPALDGQPWSHRDFPLGMFCMSLWGIPRNYMGVEELAYLMSDDPNLVEEMIEHQFYFAMETAKQIFAAGITCEWAFFWEDMCYNKGPLISPEFVKRVMYPRYRKMCDFLHEHGVKMIMLDCDGDISMLLPIWLDAGINCMHPLEVASNMDMISLRKQYGKNLLLCGGVDKRAIAGSKGDIDAEVLRVKEMLSHGGYFINMDHHMPDDISYENIVYFLNEVYSLSDYEESRRKIRIGLTANE